LNDDFFFSAPQFKRDPLGTSHTRKAPEKIVRNRIFGGIGVLWGGGLLVSKLISGQWVSDSGAYASGQIAGLVFAILLVGVGLYYLVKGGSKSTTGGSQPPPA